MALSIDEYYAGVGESRGVWAGRWAEGLDLVGWVEADELRALVEAVHPVSGVALTAGHRDRTVKAFDLTFSAPKSVSLLWAFGSAPITEVITEAHREAVGVAMNFVEDRAAVARVQTDGVRRRVPTRGLVVAGFLHRTSREGDPQLHTHCLVLNLVQRTGDGRHVALDAKPLFEWCRAAGSIYQNELQARLSRRLGVSWGPDRNNTREIDGFRRDQLRAFSKRSAQIEAELEQQGARYESPALRMKADDAASLATRTDKDNSLTPSMLMGRWQGEARQVDLAVGPGLERAVCYREPELRSPVYEELVASLVDEELGLCARSPRFTEAKVVEQLCALSGGRLTVEEITELTGRFLDSELAVRLVPEIEAGERRRPAEWSTAAHRALEDQLLASLDALTHRAGSPLSREAVRQAVAGEGRLGLDQLAAVGVLAGEGGSLRTVLAPAGYGKTAMAHAAAVAAGIDGRPVLAVATTTKAVAELAAAGLPARTIAQLRLDLDHNRLWDKTIVIVDEISQTSSRDAHTVLTAVEGCRDGTVWVLGDPRQSRSVKAGGIADEIQRLARDGRIPAAELTINRRQLDPADRHALRLLREGEAVASQQARGEHGWEHEHGTPGQTRQAMASAVCDDIVLYGADRVVALTVSHGDAEDLADRIRHRLAADGTLTGPVLIGPGWAADREYRAGDRVLLHARCGPRGDGLHNGTTAIVQAVTADGLAVLVDDGRQVALPAEFVRGTRQDGRPNLSHGWARTVDGAQGGTWELAHLLGSPALDLYRGYTGQSRSRQPTHTWNVAPIPTLDHGGLLADTRSPAEQVAAALVRQPDPRLAARSDPHLVERELLEQIAVHQAVLVRQPPDRSDAVARASAELERARHHHAHQRTAAAKTQHRLDQLGPLSGLRHAGRQQRRALEAALAADLAAVDQAGTAITRARAQLDRLRADQAVHDRFQAEHGWRQTEITTLRDRLDDHWAHVVLVCVQSDDPLAYGIDKLRHARQTATADLRRLDATIPADKSAEWNQTRRDLTAAVQARHDAHRDVDQAQNRADQANQRRWGRRDQQAIARSGRRLEQTTSRFKEAVQHEQAVRESLDGLTRHQQQRQHKLNQTHQQRIDLTGALERLDTALTDTRSQRVKALAAEPSFNLIMLLGPVPCDGLGRDLWCELATRYEAHLDRGRSPDSARVAIALDCGIAPASLNRLPELAAQHEMTAPLPGRRSQGIEASWQRVHQQEIDRDIGLGRGL